MLPLAMADTSPMNNAPRPTAAMLATRDLFAHLARETGATVELTRDHHGYYIIRETLADGHTLVWNLDSEGNAELT